MQEPDGYCPDHPGPLDDARDHVCRVRPERTSSTDVPIEVPVQPRSLINAWHNRPGRVIE